MFLRVKPSHIRESVVFTWITVAVFFRYLWFCVIVLTDWLRGFSLVDKWVYVFFLPKVLVVVVGLLVTNIPLWLLIPFAFLPVQVVGPIFFIAFIVALAR